MGKKVLVALLAVVVIAIGIGVYYFRQATALPEWYDEEAAALEVSDTDEPPAQWVALDDEGEQIDNDWPDEEAQDDPPATEAAEGAPPPAAEPKKRPRKKAKKHELRGFHRRSGKNSKGVVRASRAVIEGDKLEAGVILDLSKLPKDDLVERDRKLYDRALSNFPGLTRRNVYVGIEDQPATEDGMLRLGDAPRVRIGNLRYSLSSAARKLGMTPAELRTELDRELRRMKLKDPR